MRYLLLLLVACSSSKAAPKPQVPDTLVVADDIFGSVTAEIAFGPKPEALGAYDCEVMTPAPRQNPKPGEVVIQCRSRELYLGFNCLDHNGPDHPLRATIGLSSLKLYCKAD